MVRSTDPFKLVFAWGGLLRVLKALIPGMDNDEGIIYHDLTRNTFSNLVWRRQHDFDHDNPPLTFLVNKAWTALVNSENTYRLPSLVFSLMALWVFMLICREISRKFPDWGLALFLYFAGSSFFVYFGGILRTYSLAIFLSLLALLLFHRLREKELSVGRVGASESLVLAMVAALALWTDYSAFWCLAAALLFQITAGEWRMTSFRATLSGVLVVVPWFLYTIWGKFHRVLESKKEAIGVLVSLKRHIVEEAAAADGSGLLLRDLLVMIAHAFDAKFLLHWHIGFLALVVLGIASVMVGWLVLRRTHANSARFLGMGALIPLVVMGTFSALVSPFVDYKNIWPSTLCMTSLALGGFFLTRGDRMRKVGLMCMAIYSLLAAPLTVWRYRNDWGVYDTTLTKPVLDRIQQQNPTGKQVTVFVMNELWSATVVAYKDWHAPALPVRFVAALAQHRQAWIDMEAPIDREFMVGTWPDLTNQEGKFYFYQLIGAEDHGYFQRIAQGLGCHPGPPEPGLPGVDLRECSRL